MPTPGHGAATFHAPRLLWSASLPDAQGWTCHTASFAAMGTACAFHIHGHEPGDIQDAAMAALDEVSRIELRYNRFRSDSDLSAINRVASLGGPVELDQETAGLIDCAALCHRASGGLFDITAGALRHGASLDRIGFGRLTWDKPRLTFQAGMSLDFGGLAKEYAVDRAVEMLRFQGVRHGLVDLGGDLAVVSPAGSVDAVGSDAERAVD